MKTQLKTGYGEKTCDNCNCLHIVGGNALIRYWCRLYGCKHIGDYEKPRLPECLAAKVKP
jgi:hypothetical protein